MLARNVLLRTHGFSPCQHVFGRDPELSFDVLVPGADVAAVTMHAHDRPSERAVQICQAARKAFVESQDDKAMRRALVARPRPWREFKVGDQVAFWRKGKGRGMRSGHARWHGRAIVLAVCPGSKNVWIACRRQWLKVSQEQLWMAAVTERVADDVIYQELRAIGENSVADGQVLPKYLDISRDPPPPPADESTQKSPVERAERRDRFENCSSGSGAQTSLVQPRNTENSGSPEESVPRGRESETERSTWPHRRIVGKRAVEDETSSSVSCDRRQNLRYLPVMTRWFVCETKSKRVRAEELAVVPWSDPLDVDDEEQQKKQCTVERSEQRLSLPPPLPYDGDEVLWCELVEHDTEILAEWTADVGGLQEVTTEQLLQGAKKRE